MAGCLENNDSCNKEINYMHVRKVFDRPGKTGDDFLYNLKRLSQKVLVIPAKAGIQSSKTCQVSRTSVGRRTPDATVKF